MAAALYAPYAGEMANWNLAQFVGRNIVRMRERRGMTQDALADALGRKQPTLSDWENGHTLPRLQDLITQLEQVGIDPRELFRAEADWEGIPALAAESLPQAYGDPAIASVVAVLERLPREARHDVAELISRVADAVAPQPDDEAAELLRALANVDPVVRRGVLEAVRKIVETTTRPLSVVR